MTIAEFTIKELMKGEAREARNLAAIKRKAAKKYKMPCPKNSKLLQAYHDLVLNKNMIADKNLELLLRKRKVRSLSGVAVVSILTRPYPCGGRCIYCPTQSGVPKSYLDGEPAVMRALSHNYDPKEQILSRIKTLEANGHPTDKIDLRIIGGTWSYNPRRYQSWFIKKCFEAVNELSRIRNPKNANLNRLQTLNEKAKYRIVGINVETRPDYINRGEIVRMRKLGITQIELGVQSVYEDVLKLNRRGHGVDTVINTTKLLKDAGFKICYHIMSNLPGSTPKKDIKTFEEIFFNPDFQPDHIKIYPCALVKEAPLYWLKDKIGYRPYSAKKLVAIIKEGKKYIPYYCRIQRVIRDIPATYIIEGGTAISNLRQVVSDEMKKEGSRCRCIRCREVKENYDAGEKIYLFRQDYEASDGREIFLSFENKNRTKLLSLLRLRIPSYIFCKKNKSLFTTLKNSAFIREIHTYGQLQPLTAAALHKNSPQHKGLGKQLMREAEKITLSFGLQKIAVISAVGTREYYRKFGYQLQNTYMIKNLRN